MTRKRFVKLLMADGYSRNKANSIAKQTVADGETYGSQYWYLQFGNLFPDVTFPELKDAIGEITELIMEIIPTVFNTIAELFPLAVQQASQRIADLQEQMIMEANNE